MKTSTKLATYTLASSWAATAAAAMVLVTMITVRRMQEFSLMSHDVLIILAWLLGVGLIAQTTWAIINEGQGEHQQDLQMSQVQAAAKVGVYSSGLCSFNGGN